MSVAQYVRPPACDDDKFRRRFYQLIKVDVENKGCHYWAGARWNSNGTAVYNVGAKVVPAHVVRWWIERGDLPQRARAKNLCGHRHCVNLLHWRFDSEPHPDALVEALPDPAPVLRPPALLTIDVVDELQGFVKMPGGVTVFTDWGNFYAETPRDAIARAMAAKPGSR